MSRNTRSVETSFLEHLLHFLQFVWMVVSFVTTDYKTWLHKLFKFDLNILVRFSFVTVLDFVTKCRLGARAQESGTRIQTTHALAWLLPLTRMKNSADRVG